MRVLRSFVALLLLVGCNQAPADLRPWRASDHDHTTDPGANQVAGGPDAGVDPELAAHGLNEVVLVAWEQNCVRCHGRFGRGDGPQGAMLRTADLASPRVQASTDEQLLAVIRDGRGLMPAFPLPDTTLRTLVQLIRLLGKAATQGAPSASAAPSAAPPTASGRPKAAPVPVPVPAPALSGR